MHVHADVDQRYQKAAATRFQFTALAKPIDAAENEIAATQCFRIVLPAAGIHLHPRAGLDLEYSSAGRFNLELAEADAELQWLNLLQKNHLDEQYFARRSVRDLPETIASLSKRLSSLTTDQATAAEQAADRTTIGERSYSRDDTPYALGESLRALPERVMQKQRFPLGTYRGLRFGMVLNPQWAPEVYLEGAITRPDTLSRDHLGPRAVLNALNRLANGYSSECARLQQDLTLAESQLRDYRERLGKPFPHEAYLTELTELRDRLKAALSGGKPDPASETGHSISAELADRIKVLKDAHTIDAAPQRTRLNQAMAEEPVTARIRRRQEARRVLQPVVRTANRRKAATRSLPVKGMQFFQMTPMRSHCLALPRAWEERWSSHALGVPRARAAG
jgi:hypothetical protein